MVLDAKALTWAAKNDIDTAKLKKAKVPIYGKWYFPEIPPNVVLINLETGEQRLFPERMVAGEVIFVPAAELLRAGLAPADMKVMEAPAPTGAEGGTRALRAIWSRPPASWSGAARRRRWSREAICRVPSRRTCSSWAMRATG